MAEGIRIRRDSPFLSRAVTWLLALGALSAVLAAGSGWFLALIEHVRSDERATLEWHRWLGLATALAGCLAWAAAARWSGPVTGARLWLRRGLVWSAAALVTIAGHLGAVIVWGKDWFS